MYNRIVTIISLVIMLGVYQQSAAQSEKESKFGVLGNLKEMYHGLPLNDRGKVIDISAKDMQVSFEIINSNFSKSLPREDAKSLQQLSKSLEEKGLLSEQLALLLKGVQTQLIVDRNKDLRSRNLNLSVRYLREIFKAYPNRDPERFNREFFIELPSFVEEREIFIRPEIIELIRQWTIWDKFEFLKYCALNDVPQPPDWGTAAWVRKKDGAVDTVPAERLYTLNTPGYTTEVWTSTDHAGRGGCIALPRKKGSITTLGVICQNKETGNACFWDNRPHAGGTKFSDAEMIGAKKSIVKHWVNGRDAALVGGGKCVMCHRGENAFLLHQDTLLSNNPPMPFDTSSDKWYTMINSLGWVNPPKTVLAGNSGCVSCHEIGGTTDAERLSYCGILKQAANAEMPSIANPVSWDPAAGTPERTHIDIMKGNGCPP